MWIINSIIWWTDEKTYEKKTFCRFEKTYEKKNDFVCRFLKNCQELKNFMNELTFRGQDRGKTRASLNLLSFTISKKNSLLLLTLKKYSRKTILIRVWWSKHVEIWFSRNSEMKKILYHCNHGWKRFNKIFHWPHRLIASPDFF